MVRNARVSAGLTQKELAGLCKMSASYLADVEHDRYADLTTGTVRKLRAHLPALTCDDLLNADPPPKTEPEKKKAKRPRGRPRKSS